ncbi:hypothetical protein BX600DRAFT_503656 [Xylariales sp. PMI_506]|nr:hypothetical protein BX600DRAFT_503656 [Xylariales sp. PMI_506]
MSPNKLRSEILQPFFSHISSLESLDKLLRDSIKALNYFNAHGVNLFEAVLSSRKIHEHTCALIRITALIRSFSLPPEVRSFTSFRDLVRHESTSHRYDHPVWHLAPTKLTNDVPASTLLSPLGTQRRIDYMVTKCLQFYLDRFRALRLFHLTDTKFVFGSGNYKGRSQPHYIGAWEQNPSQTAFPVYNIGSPTWLEEQRVLRAFWRFQLFNDLKTAREKSLLEWSDTDLKRLDEATVMDLHDPFGDYNDFDDSSPEPELVLDEDHEPNIYQQDTLVENEAVRYAMEYTEAEQVVVPEDPVKTRKDWPILVEGEMDWEYFSYHNYAPHAFFHEVMGSSHGQVINGPCSPIQHISFDPFRRLGFAIWSIERMVGYGFLQPIWNPEKSESENKPFTRNSVLNAWRSVLSDDELAEVAEINNRMLR